MNDAWMQYGRYKYHLGTTAVPCGQNRYTDRLGASDVADALAKINRFTGHSVTPYSVADHSLFVSDLLASVPVNALYGLVHDVAETVVQDLSQPMKQALGDEGLAHYRKIEDAAELMLFDALEIVHPDHLDQYEAEVINACVKHADWVAVATEKRDIMKRISDDYRTTVQDEWPMLPCPPSHLIIPHTDRNWKVSAERWLKQLNRLKCMVPDKYLRKYDPSGRG